MASSSWDEKLMAFDSVSSSRRWTPPPLLYCWGRTMLMPTTRRVWNKTMAELAWWRGRYDVFMILNWTCKVVLRFSIDLWAQLAGWGVWQWYGRCRSNLSCKLRTKLTPCLPDWSTFFFTRRFGKEQNEWWPLHNVPRMKQWRNWFDGYDNGKSQKHQPSTTTAMLACHAFFCWRLQ